MLVLVACILGRWWVLAPSLCGRVLFSQLVSHVCSCVLLVCVMFFFTLLFFSVLFLASIASLSVYTGTTRFVSHVFSSLEAMGCGVVLGAVAYKTTGRFAQVACEGALMARRRSVGQ